MAISRVKVWSAGEVLTAADLNAEFNNFIGLGSLSIASGKVLTVSNSLTLAGTDGTVMTFPTTSAAIARTDAAQEFTAAQTFTAAVPQKILGANTTTLGAAKFFGSTSGSVTVQPAAIAGGTLTCTLPNANSTLPIFTQQITFAGPTVPRTITLPDAAFTVARSDAGLTLTGDQIITGTLTSGAVGGTLGSLSLKGTTSGTAIFTVDATVTKVTLE